MIEKILNKTEYETTLKENTYIHVGGKTDNFVPNLNMGKWNDECWLNINHPDIVNDEKEIVVDGKTTIKIGDKTHRFYVDENGDFEYDIIFDKQPPSNVIEYNLDFPEGLNFWYQDELTQEEIDLGAVRPENSVGSYAVYWKNRDNHLIEPVDMLDLSLAELNLFPLRSFVDVPLIGIRERIEYKTGKFCHIYRPMLIDAKGVKRWASLSIDPQGKVMSIICDFKDLVFPVILDPTIGYSTAGASNYGSSTAKWGTTFQAPASTGVTQTYHCAIAAISAGTPGIKLGIYETTDVYGPTYPHSPRNQALVEQVEFDVGVSDDESTAGGGATITANTWYWLGPIEENSATKMKYDTGGGTNQSVYDSGLTYASEMANPWSNNASGSDRLFSIWVDYSGGTDYQKTLSETVGVSDAISTSGGYVKSISDTVGITDILTASMNYVKALADTVGITDAISRIVTYIRTVSDTVGITDALSRVANYVRSIGDSVGITDVINAFIKLTTVYVQILSVESNDYIMKNTDSEVYIEQEIYADDYIFLNIDSEDSI